MKTPMHNKVGRRTPCAPLPSASPHGAHGVPRPTKEIGSLMAEMMVGVAILTVVLFPLGYSFAKEGKLLRASYNRAVAIEIVDGEMEVLLAGEWRAFKEGTQNYQPHARAATNLPGEFQLTIKGQRLRLEWLPSARGKGGNVVREVTVK